MELMHRHNNRGMESFHREMDRLWNRFFDETLPAGTLDEEWLPHWDVAETEDNLVVSVELPGLEKKDVGVSLVGDILTIKGEKKDERTKEGKYYHCTECHFGSFQRSFRIPVNVQGDKVDAGFEKGVLTITLPKSEEAKQKETKIEIH